MVKIAEIVDQNPWWREGKDFIKFDQCLSRAKPIFFRRKEMTFEKNKIYIVRGPRQVGKTTYIKDTIDKLIQKNVPARQILYLAMDFFTSRREIRNAVNYFLDYNRDKPEFYIFLDEITTLDDWNLELKFMADQGLIKNGVILATGSNAIRLKEKAELMPGRGIEGNEYFIKPLCFREFASQTIDYITSRVPNSDLGHSLINLKDTLKRCTLILAKDINSIKAEVEKILPFKRELDYLFNIYLITGGFPMVINDYLSKLTTDEEQKIARSHAEVFIRDVIGDFSKLQKSETITRQILKTIVTRYGSRYSFSEFAREIEKTHVTIIDYLEYLEDSFISFVLYAYDFNKKEIKLKGNKKIYFFDPFILNSVKSWLTGNEIRNIVTDMLMDEDMLGKIVEGIVIAHMLMHRETPLLKTSKTFLGYYYSNSGKEIDVIFKDNNRYWGVEVKYQNQVSIKEIKEISGVKHYLLLTKNDFAGTDEIMALPVNIFLALLAPSDRNL